MQGALLAAAVGVYGLLAVMGLVGGTIGYGVRSFYGYLRTKEKYQLNLTESLYYQNLDNNAGVMFRLIDEAEQQEHREALLGYFFLWRQAGQSGLTAGELDGAIEAYLSEQVGRPIDFEVADALAKLERLRLVAACRSTPLDGGVVAASHPAPYGAAGAKQAESPRRLDLAISVAHSGVARRPAAYAAARNKKNFRSHCYGHCLPGCCSPAWCDFIDLVNLTASRNRFIT